MRPWKELGPHEVEAWQEPCPQQLSFWGRGDPQSHNLNKTNLVPKTEGK